MGQARGDAIEAIGFEEDVETKALPFVFEYCKGIKLLKLRQVSQKWNKIVCTWLNEKMIFKVCDNTLSLDAFKNLSASFKVHRFKFEGLDLEALFGNADIFRRFAMGHCLEMTCLLIHNCNLSTSRFFELLAFCKQLKRLNVRNTPLIYKIDSGIGIFNWAFCFKALRENLARIESLSLAEYSLRHTDIWGLASGMKNLRILHVGSEGFLPLRGINETLKGCCNTLKMLVLKGGIEDPGLDIGTEVEMQKLQKLFVHRTKNVTHVVKHLERFLKKCPQLSVLRIQQCKVEKSTLACVQEKLTELTMSGCILDPNAFDNAKFSNLSVLCAFINSEAVGVDVGVISLLKCEMPQLTELELGLPLEGSAYLKHLEASKCPKLTTLSLNNCVDIAGRPLRKIFKDFKGLTSLSIKNCRDIIDENICCPSNNDTVASLADMQNLKVLNLSQVNIGNQSVHECIVKMEKLENINLTDTQVTVDGMNAIIHAVQSTLTSLKSVTINSCNVEKKAFKELVKLAPTVNIGCNILTSDGTTVEIQSISP